jgi:hypothetical protein
VALRPGVARPQFRDEHARFLGHGAEAVGDLVHLI